MYLTHNGVKHNVFHWPVKMRYVTKAREVMERINAITKDAAGGVQMAAWQSALQRWPELSMYIDTRGAYNAKTVLDRVNANEKAYKEAHATVDDAPPFDREAAVEEAKAWCQQRVTDMLMETPELTRIITFTTGAYPTTIEALTEGITIIKETVDRERTHADMLALIDSSIDHDFWQDVDAQEVAHYVDSFRLAFQQRAVQRVEVPAVADSVNEAEG